MTTPIAASATPLSNALRIIAGSAESGGDEALSDLFGRWVGEGAVLYLPLAKPDDDPRIPTVSDRLWQHLEPSGVTELVTWFASDLEAPDFEPDVSAFKGIYLGDGDPSRLRMHVFASGLYDPLIAAAQAGCVMFGTSAGTMMLGTDSAGASGSASRPRKDMEPEAYRGLGLAHDPDGKPAIMIPHMTPTKEGMAQKIADGLRLPVCGIRDGNAYLIDQGVPGTIGDTNPTWYLPGSATTGRTISLPQFARSYGPGAH